MSDEQAVASAIRMVKEGGADVVKLEGAGRMVSRVRAIAESNIGVMGHVGLTPQSATKLGGFKAQGRTRRCGASSSTTTRSRCRRQVRSRSCSKRCRRRSRPASPRRCDVPTIGIGAGAGTDGQVLVWHDMLGMYAGRTPRFVKRYAEIADEIGDAVAQYAADVRSGAFPEEKHTYGISPTRSSSGSSRALRAELSGEHHDRPG